jgi:hypothetical protein
MHRCIWSLLLASSLLAQPIAGQTQVSGIRDLTFGVVVAGVPSTVSPNDPVNSGQFYLRYVRGGKVRISLTLPSALNQVGGGGTLPISFRNADAFVLETAPGSVPNSFNPKATLNLTLTGSPDLNLFLGGSVSPASAAPPGSYTAPVIVTVIFF